MPIGVSLVLALVCLVGFPLWFAKQDKVRDWSVWAKYPVGVLVGWLVGYTGIGLILSMVFGW